MTGVNFIAELTPLTDEWRIKVMIIRLWTLTSFKNPLEPYKIDMVLQDEKGTQCHATIIQEYCTNFQNSLEEGKCVYISTFSYTEIEGDMLVVDHPYQIKFYDSTTVIPCDDYTGSIHGFRFASFDTLKKTKQPSTVSYDLIGYLSSCGDVKDTFVKGRKHITLRVELEDLSGTKLDIITLWDDYATQLDKALGDRKNLGQVVVIMQYMKHTVKNFTTTVSNMFGATKLFINDDIPDIQKYKKQLLDARPDDGSNYEISKLSTFSTYSVKDDFLNNLKRVSVDDIQKCKKNMSCVVIATIKKIERGVPWWYYGCVKCNRATKQDLVTEKDDFGVIVKKRVVYICTTENCDQNTNVEYKFKIPLRVLDSTGSVSLTIFDRLTQKLINKTAAELVMEMRKGGDTKAIPEDFSILIDKTYAFKVDISDSKKGYTKKSFVISKYTDDPEIIARLVNKDDEELEITSTPATSKHVDMCQNVNSTLSPTSKTPTVKSVTGDNMESRVEDNVTATTPCSSKLKTVIDLENEPLLSLSTTKLLTPKKEIDDY